MLSKMPDIGHLVWMIVKVNGLWTSIIVIRLWRALLPSSGGHFAHDSRS